ncbi:MAG: type IV pilus twitching motility protein PilT [Candidatus Omnitrophica bacterium]|nr:type IV pilus twitching motility protein PilT [Candidatus Omnitrophota bacterium]
MDEMLKEMVHRGASDLHISVGCPPHIRLHGSLVPLEGCDSLSPEMARELIYTLLDPQQIKRFENDKELDFAFGVKGLSRFRVNVFYQRASVGAAIRALPFRILTFEDIGMPADVMLDLCSKPKGLVLVTGATGSGKSTTLASMVDQINQTRACHIVTIEDPIEFVHTNKRAVVDQREVHSDTHSFNEALRHILRQDPDVIMIGEMRDLETIEAALNIAETGHLVFATLHTSDAVQSINRIIDVFPAHKQDQVRTQLSFVIIGALSQQLLPRSDGAGRVLASEILLVNHAVRALIREGKIHQVFSVMQTCSREGMSTMNQSLFELYSRGVIDFAEAMGRTNEPDDLKRLFKQ